MLGLTATHALPVGHLRKALIHCLQQGKPFVSPAVVKWAVAVSIHLHPPEASKRKKFGHRRADPLGKRPDERQEQCVCSGHLGRTQ